MMRVLTAFCIGLQPLAAWADAPKSKEDIYVVRSFRIARLAPTSLCSRAGFGKLLYEDHFLFKSINLRTADGLVVDANVATVGKLQACFGETGDPQLVNFFATGNLGSTAFVGRGECVLVRQDFPEPGILPYRCHLDLQGLPSPYTGGQLTTNTITSRQVIGAVSDPPGYTQPSIATVRLWRSPPDNRK
jgi:hypothetical protein